MQYYINTNIFYSISMWRTGWSAKNCVRKSTGAIYLLYSYNPCCFCKMIFLTTLYTYNIFIDSTLLSILKSQLFIYYFCVDVYILLLSWKTIFLFLTIIFILTARAQPDSRHAKLCNDAFSSYRSERAPWHQFFLPLFFSLFLCFYFFIFVFASNLNELHVPNPQLSQSRHRPLAVTSRFHVD